MPNVPKIIIRELVPFLKHLFVERQHVTPGGRHSPWFIDSTLSFLAVVLFRKSVTFSTSYYKKYTEIRNILHERILPSQIDTTVCFFFCDLGVRIWPANSNITTSNSSAKAIMAAPFETVVRSVYGWRFPGILIWTVPSQSVGDWCVLTIVHPPNMAIRFLHFIFRNYSCCHEPMLVMVNDGCCRLQNKNVCIRLHCPLPPPSYPLTPPPLLPVPNKPSGFCGR